jgi:acyl-CoA thioesterase
MSTTFSKLMASAKGEGGTVVLDVPADWMQGRSVFGGLQMALALRAMRTLVPASTLRTLQATFIGPVKEGAMHARAQVLRSGKNAVHVEARIVDGDVPLAIVIGVFGEARRSAVTLVPSRPHVTVAEGVRLRALSDMPGMAPSFTQHFDAQWMRGAPPFSGDRAREHVIALAMKDDGNATEEHVVALADFIPPIALTYLEGMAPASTLTWMLEVVADKVDHLPLRGWRVDAELVAGHDGYTSQSVMLWGPDGAPVAISRQSMLVFG